MSGLITPTPGDPQIAIIDKFPSHRGRTTRMNGEPVGEEIPRQSRVRDRNAMKKCRAKNKCEFPGCKLKATDKWNRLDPHHRHPRGSGGGDEDLNLACICREHHTLIHNDPASRAALEAVIERRLELSATSKPVPS